MRARTVFVLSAGAFFGGTIATFALLADVSVASYDAGLVTGVVGVLAGLVGALVTDILVPGERIERTRDARVLWLLAVPAIALFAGVGLGLGVAGEGETAYADVAFLWTAVAAAGVVGLRHAGQSRYADRLVAESERRVEVPGTLTVKWERVARWFAVAVIGLTVLLVLAARYVGDPTPWLTSIALGGAGLSVLATTGRDRVVTERGVKDGVRFEPWAVFEHYRVESEDVVVSRAAWWRSEVRIPRDRLEDEDALLELLSSSLPTRHGD